MSVDDVCPQNLDYHLDNMWKSMINGTAGRRTIDGKIQMNNLLITMLHNSSAIEKLERENRVLNILRRRQKHD